MRIGKLIITVDHTHDHAPHYGKHALKTSIIAVTVASALTLTVFAADYNSHGILKYDQNSDGTAEIELNGAEIQNLGAAAANQEANLENTHTTLTTIKDQNTELKTSTTDLSNKVEGLASTVQASLAKNGVCMNTDGGSSGVIGNYKQALASASSDYNSTTYSGSKTNSSNLNLSDSINCINNIGKLPADHSDNVVGITALSDNDLKDFTTAHPDAPTAEQKTAGNEKVINYTSQLMAGSGAWMADDGGLKWYEGTTVNKGSSKILIQKSYTAWTNKTFDIAAIAKENGLDYTTLTDNDFFVKPIAIDDSPSYCGINSIYWSLAYDAGTGALTINRFISPGTTYGHALTFDLYLIP